MSDEAVARLMIDILMAKLNPSERFGQLVWRGSEAIGLP
jgi:hypothetical protein